MLPRKNQSALVLADLDFLDNNVVKRLIHEINSRLGNFVNNVHSVINLTENRMLEIKPRSSADLLVILNSLSREHSFSDHFHLTHEITVNRACLNNEELAAVCARTCVRHRECTSEVVKSEVKLILK